MTWLRTLKVSAIPRRLWGTGVSFPVVLVIETWYAFRREQGRLLTSLSLAPSPSSHLSLHFKLQLDTTLLCPDAHLPNTVGQINKPSIAARLPEVEQRANVFLPEINSLAE
jgi:hypothetical protein